MKRIILILTLLLSTAFSAFAQIEDEIANYQSNRELMEKARDYIKDKVVDGDFAKVKEAKDYALTLKEENANPFSRSELWSIMFLTNEFEALGNDIATVNKDNYYLRSVRWNQDGLEDVLNKALKENKSDLNNRLKSSTIDIETMNVLRMTLDWLENGAGRVMTSKMHDRAVAHLAVNPDSKYKWFIEQKLMVESLPNRSTDAPSFRHRNVWSIGYVASLGGGWFASDLADSYKGFGSCGFELTGAFNRVALTAGINFMPTWTKCDITGDNGVLEKGSGVTVFMPKGSFGYYLIQKDKFRMKPYLGVAGLLFRYPSVANKPDYSDLNFNLLTYCGGCNFGFKFRTGLNGYELLSINYMFGISPYNGAKGIGTMHMISVGYSMEAFFYGRH